MLSDQIVRLKGNAHSRPDHPLRLVCVKCSPHTSRGKYRGGSSGVDSDGILRIATNLLEAPAEIISLIYAHRWAIEIFFRFFKHILGCRHLLSRSQSGIEIQTYCAIIACLLISLWTGRKPTLRTYEMFCLYFCGLASEKAGPHRQTETSRRGGGKETRRQGGLAQKLILVRSDAILFRVRSPFTLRGCRPRTSVFFSVATIGDHATSAPDIVAP